MAELLESLDAPRNTRAQAAPSPRDPRTPEQSFADLMAAASGVVPAGASAPASPKGEAALGGGSWTHRVGVGADAAALAKQRLAGGNSRHDPAARLAGKVEAEVHGSSNGADSPTRVQPHARRAEPGSTGRQTQVGAPSQAAGPTPAPAPAQRPASVPAGESQASSPAPSGAPHQPVAGAIAGAPSTGSLSNAAAAPASGGAGVQGVGGSARAGAVGQTNSDARGVISTRVHAANAAGAKGAGTSQARTAPKEDVPAQAMRGLAALLRRKGGSVTLRLTPEALGDLKVSMRLEKHRVWARIEASSATARDLLKEQRDSLRSALEARGLKVERLEIAAEPNPVDRGVPTGAGGSPEQMGGFAGGDLRDRRQPSEHGLPRSGGGPGIVAAGGDGADERIVWLRGARPGTWAEPSASGLRWRVDAVA